jgi:hypothetical protein
MFGKYEHLNKLEEQKMKLKEKLKALADVLTEDQLVSLEEQIKTMVSDEVALRVEEKTTELDKEAELYCEQEVEKRVAEIKETLIEQYDEKLEELENTIVEKVDQFLEMEVTSQISDEMIEKVAMNETFKPIVEGIQKLFEEKYVALDSEGNKVLAETKAEVKELKDKLNEAYAEKLELSKLAESAAVKLKISEKTEDLTESQKQRVKVFFEDKSFDEVESKIDSFVEMISETAEEDKDKTIIAEEKNFSTEDGTIEKTIEEANVANVNESEEVEQKTPYHSTINTAQKFL